MLEERVPRLGGTPVGVDTELPAPEVREAGSGRKNLRAESVLGEELRAERSPEGLPGPVERE